MDLSRVLPPAIRGPLVDARDRIRPRSKEEAELAFWRSRHRAEIVQGSATKLGNDWYQRAFTAHFELPRTAFDDKRVLDIGCGPRGSLEWADRAAKRVGLDPLVGGYRELGIDQHEMEYVEAPAESMPFEDGAFDIVSVLNALDHVEDIDASLREMSRVTAPGGLILIAVEVRHKPTSTEPHWLDWDIVERVPGTVVEWSARNGMRRERGMYGSLDDDLPYTRDPGILRARLRRLTSSDPGASA